MMFTVSTLARTVGTLGVTAALTLVASPAMAASNGSDVIKEVYCQDLGYAIECASLHWEMHFIITPSGSVISQDNMRNGVTVTFPDGYSYSSVVTEHNQGVRKGGVSQEFGARYALMGSDTIFKQPCTFRMDAHFANGRYQFDNLSDNCTP